MYDRAAAELLAVLPAKDEIATFTSFSVYVRAPSQLAVPVYLAVDGVRAHLQLRIICQPCFVGMWIRCTCFLLPLPQQGESPFSSKVIGLFSCFKGESEVTAVVL